MTARKVIASTFSLDAAELNEYRYHDTRTRLRLYAIGDDMITVSAVIPTPKDCGGNVYD